MGPYRAATPNNYHGVDMVLSASPKSGWFREGRIGQKRGLCSRPLQVLGNVFFLRTPFFRLGARAPSFAPVLFSR